MKNKLAGIVLGFIAIIGGFYACARKAPDEPKPQVVAVPSPTPETEIHSLGLDSPAVRVTKGTKVLRSSANALLAVAEAPCVLPGNPWEQMSYSYADNGASVNWQGVLNLSDPITIPPCYVDVTPIATYSTIGSQEGVPIRIHLIAPSTKYIDGYVYINGTYANHVTTVTISENGIITQTVQSRQSDGLFSFTNVKVGSSLSASLLGCSFQALQVTEASQTYVIQGTCSLATPTPTPLPSPTPTATPTATPSPTPVASPTPLPFCASGQRPGNPPVCRCRNGYSGNSGKCR